MNKKKKSPSQKKSHNGKKRSSSKAADPEMDVLQERFSSSSVDFGSLLDLVK